MWQKAVNKINAKPKSNPWNSFLVILQPTKLTWLQIQPNKSQPNKISPNKIQPDQNWQD